MKCEWIAEIQIRETQRRNSEAFIRNNLNCRRMKNVYTVHCIGIFHSIIYEKFASVGTAWTPKQLCCITRSIRWNCFRKVSESKIQMHFAAIIESIILKLWVDSHQIFTLQLNIRKLQSFLPPTPPLPASNKWSSNHLSFPLIKITNDFIYFCLY